MAIKYFHIDNQYKTVGVLTDCKYDCVNKIRNMLAGTSIQFDESKYLLNNSYRAVVVACEEDKENYDHDMGKAWCKKKLLKKYYKSFDIVMDRFKKDLEKAYKIIS